MTFVDETRSRLYRRPSAPIHYDDYHRSESVGTNILIASDDSSSDHVIPVTEESLAIANYSPPTLHSINGHGSGGKSFVRIKNHICKGTSLAAPPSSPSGSLGSVDPGHHSSLYVDSSGSSLIDKRCAELLQYFKTAVGGIWVSFLSFTG